MVQLHLGVPSALREAVRFFKVIEDPIYANKHLGSSGKLEVMTCECEGGDHHSHLSGTRTRLTKARRPSLGKRGSQSNGRARQGSADSSDEGSDEEPEEPEEPEELCGPNSNCVNRLTYMECYDEFCCSESCANRRFQKHQHAKVDVFNAGKKGYGVRALEFIAEGSFIYEYTGEVLDEQRFQRRQQKYDREGVKHFYFMMLQKDEFIDATEKGSIARFCNHSCNPNAQIEKWVVGPKLRMGLFAKRDIQKGEEICFDYKVDRYGSKAQPCYCGEPNCSGFLGGRTQTGGILLPPSVVEGLGLDSDIALSWPESALQKLQLHVSKLGLDLESVLSNESQSSVKAAHQQLSPQQNGSQGQETPSLHEQPEPLNEDEGDQIRNQNPSQSPSPDSPGESSPPSSKDKKKKPYASKAKKADLIGLLDAQPSSLKEPTKNARQFLLDLLPSNALTYDELSEYMRILMQTQDRGWLVSLMLARIIASEQPVQLAILRMHGYEIMATVLNRWRKQSSVIATGINVLQHWPKVTRNKISSSQIESVVRELGANEELAKPVRDRASALLQEWKGLSMGYRIPRRKLPEENSSTGNSKTDDSTRSPEPNPASSVPRNPLEGRITANSSTENLGGSGTGSNGAGTSSKIEYNERQAKPRALPEGWEVLTSRHGQKYYYNAKEDMTSWIPPRDPRDVERENRAREKEQREERERQELLQKSREQQANEIQRIIEEAEGTISANASGDSSLLSPSRPNTPGAHTQQRANSKSPSRKSKPPTLEGMLAAYVPKLVFGSEKELGRDRCKRHARDIVHILVKKEQAKGTDPSKAELSSEKKRKIKEFVKEYMAKLVARRQLKVATTGSERSSVESTPKKMKTE